MPGLNKPSALKVSFFDTLGRPIEKTYGKNNVTMVTSVYNPADVACSARLITAFFKDGVLIEAAYEDVLIEKRGTASLKLTNAVPEDADSVYAYVWTDSLIPLTPIKAITVRPPYYGNADE